MSSSPDVLIIGGGVIGLSCAYFLAEAGLKVELVERQALGREASWAGAGIIPPGNPQRARSPLDQLRAQSVSQFPSFTRMLEETTGLPTGFRICGGIEFLDDESEYAVELWDDELIEYEKFDEAQLRILEPNLASGGRQGPVGMPGQGADALRSPSAFFLPGMGQVRNPWYLRALIAGCERLGVRLRPDCPVARWKPQNDQIESVELVNGEEITAGNFVLAAGAWAEPWLNRLDIRNIVHPVRGQMLLYRTPAPILNRVVICGKRYFVPREDGRLLVGSTEEPEAGFVKETTPEGIAELKAFAESLVPVLKYAELESSWAGLRPGSADGYPAIGRLPFHSNVFAAVGHFRAGIQLSLGTARLIRDLLIGHTPFLDLAPFAPNRVPNLPPRTAFRS